MKPLPHNRTWQSLKSTLAFYVKRTFMHKESLFMVFSRWYCMCVGSGCVINIKEKSQCILCQHWNWKYLVRALMSTECIAKEYVQ